MYPFRNNTVKKIEPIDLSVVLPDAVAAKLRDYMEAKRLTKSEIAITPYKVLKTYFPASSKGNIYQAIQKL